MFKVLQTILSEKLPFEIFSTYGKAPSSASSRHAGASNFAITTEEPAPDPCGDCREDHAAELCPNLTSVTVDQCRDLVAEHGLCYSCLRKGHWVTKCQAGMKCTVSECGRRHHTLLHPDGATGQSQRRNKRSQRTQQGRGPPGGRQSGPPRLRENSDSATSAATAAGP